MIMNQNVITTECLEFTNSNFKFSVTINRDKEMSKTFNIKVNNNKIRFNPDDLKTLMMFPKVVTAFLRAPYPNHAVEINVPILYSEYYPLEVITHLSRRKLSDTIDYDLPDSRMIYWNQTPFDLPYKGTPYYNDRTFDVILPVSGGKDSMLVRSLMEKGNKTIFDFIMNYGGYRWSLSEKYMAYEKLPSVNIYPAEFGTNFGGTRKLYSAFEKSSSQWGKHYSDTGINKSFYIDMYCFFNYIIGILLATKFQSYLTPAIERPHYRYKKHDGIWAYMFDETHIAIEAMRELCSIIGVNNKIASPIIMLDDTIEYDLLHKIGYKQYGDIITSCGFGKNRWCNRCHKDLQAYLRLLINDINPELYGMDIEQISKKNEMIKTTKERYDKYIYENREIISNEELGYIRNYIETNNIILPQKISTFLKLFELNTANKSKLFKIRSNEYSFLPSEFKFIKKYLKKYPHIKDGRYINYSTFANLSLQERIKFISKTYKIKEHVLIRG